MIKKIRPIIIAGMVMAVLVAVITCGGDDDSGIRFGGGGIATPAIPGAEFTTRLEVPKLKTGNTFVAHTVAYNNRTVMNYCLEFDPTMMHSRWVAFRFDGITRQRKVSRSDSWTDDPLLPTSMHVGTEYFSGYNRGHLVASNDRRFCLEANQQTFYMSNMSPQIGNFNSPYWAKLEQIVQHMGWNATMPDKEKDFRNFADTLYVVKGGYIDDPQEVRSYIQRPNGTRMAVPGHYFMALLRLKGTTYNAVAFWLEHKNYPYSGDTKNVPNNAFLDHIMSVDRLEQLTGIDFFHNLPDDIENRVEAECSTGLWL